MVTQLLAPAGSSARIAPPAVRVQEIRKSFGEPPHRVDVLLGVDLQIRPGQFVLITGPSGSGKTTLLTIMGLLLQPTSGRLWLGGDELSDCGEAELAAIRRRRVSFIFQSFNLLSALSAVENVQVGLELHGVRGRDAEKRASDLLARVGMAHRAAHRPADLSGGEKQRVGIARALASPGQLVLADEPTGNLDSATARPAIELLRQLAHEENRAVVVVTHDPRLEALADRIVRMEDGRIVEDTLEDDA